MKPLYYHECKKCRFLGSRDGLDFYFCFNPGGLSTVIARRSDWRSWFECDIPNGECGPNTSIAKALAIEQGIFVENNPGPWNDMKKPDSQYKDSTIPWDEAVRMVKELKVVHVKQYHSREVVMHDGSGDRFATTEPYIDAIWRLIEEVDPHNKRIEFITQ